MTTGLLPMIFSLSRIARLMRSSELETTRSPDSFLTVVDIRTGQELWRSETITLGTFTTPAVADGIVVVGSLPFGDRSATGSGLFAFPANRAGK